MKFIFWRNHMTLPSFPRRNFHIDKKRKDSLSWNLMVPQGTGEIRKFLVKHVKRVKAYKLEANIYSHLE